MPDLPQITEPRALALLRERIDRIDDQIHDLLMARASLYGEIGRTKSGLGGGVVNPARETAILRRLAARHEGGMPVAVVARIWREIIGAAAVMQQPGLTVAIAAGAGASDLARDHFGTLVTLVEHKTARVVIEEVVAGRAAIGLVPYPENHEADRWWPDLLAHRPERPMVTARLPFIPMAQASSAVLLAVARVGAAPLVADRHLLAIEIRGDADSARVGAALREYDVDGTVAAVWARGQASVVLLDLASPLDLLHPDVVRLSRALGSDDIVLLGGYDLPLAPTPARVSNE